MPTWTRERIIEEVKQLAAQSNGPVSGTAFRRRLGLTEDQFRGLFPGRWAEVRQLAGIAPHPHDSRRCKELTREELLEEFHRLVCQLRTVPNWDRVAALAKFSPYLYRKHFGGKLQTVQGYREWLEKNHPDCPFLRLLARQARNESTAGLPNLLTGARHWSKGAGIVYGAPINFRGLRHAPTNELGVVYLFGMVSAELGISVEAVQPAFPDCQAKRCVDDRQNCWQLVRIEFEFRSSNFRDHGHDPAGCDLIVCWEHDWPDCPLEVIELRAVIAKLDNQ
jgi:hypothetical protein